MISGIKPELALTKIFDVMWYHSRQTIFFSENIKKHFCISHHSSTLNRTDNLNPLPQKEKNPNSTQWLFMTWRNNESDHGLGHLIKNLFCPDYTRLSTRRSKTHTLNKSDRKYMFLGVIWYPYTGYGLLMNMNQCGPSSMIFIQWVENIKEMNLLSLQSMAVDLVK